MKQLFILLCFFIAIAAHSQHNDFFSVKKDSSAFILSEKGASMLAGLPLKCIDKEYPNKTNHTSHDERDHVMTPRQLHPAFYGCFDWHSCVHGHWMMIRLLKEFPDLPESSIIRAAINATITADNIAAEVKYFDDDLNKGWERTYGWAWLLKLDEELSTWNDTDGKKWHQLLQPLTETVITLWTNFLPKQTYPNRTGVHPNSAFGLVFALDYARTLNNTEFEKAIVAHARRIFLKDKNAPTEWEPDGSDFLSPSLEEADLMRRILPQHEFIAWFNKFIPLAGLKHLTELPIVSDRNDYQIVHLDGLCFSRSWCMKGIAKILPRNDPRRKLLQRAAINHLAAALPHVAGGSYGGEHWLASFAVYALVD